MFRQFEPAECDSNNWKKSRHGRGKKDFCGAWRKANKWIVLPETIDPPLVSTGKDGTGEITYKNYEEIYFEIIRRWTVEKSDFKYIFGVDHFEAFFDANFPLACFPALTKKHGKYIIVSAGFWEGNSQGQSAMLAAKGRNRNWATAMERLKNRWKNVYKKHCKGTYLNQIKVEDIIKKAIEKIKGAVKKKDNLKISEVLKENYVKEVLDEVWKDDWGQQIKRLKKYMSKMRPISPNDNDWSDAKKTEKENELRDPAALLNFDDEPGFKDTDFDIIYLIKIWKDFPIVAENY